MTNGEMQFQGLINRCVDVMGEAKLAELLLVPRYAIKHWALGEYLPRQHTMSIFTRYLVGLMMKAADESKE